MGNNNWSEWKRFGSNEIRNVPKKSGIYKIRYLNGSKPEMLSRLKRKDIEGIIYIGKTTNLHRRLNEFYIDIKKSDKPNSPKYPRSKFPHSAGERYVRLGYKGVFNRQNLQFSWCLVDKEELEDAEWGELKKYHEGFFDLPPLNFSLPSKWWKDLTT